MKAGNEIDAYIHPEVLAGELFLSNLDTNQFEILEFKSKRRGDLTFDGNGKAILHEDWFPVFISTEEFNNCPYDLQNLRRKVR